MVEFSLLDNRTDINVWIINIRKDKVNQTNRNEGD